MKRNTLLLLLLTVAITSFAQKKFPTVQVVAQGTKTSIRGLSVVNNFVVWASGSNGTVGLSANGGKDWKWMKVKGFEKADFRDIEAFDAHTAVIIAVGEPAYILRTTDAGESWKLVFEDKTKGMFLDAMEFWNKNDGKVIGDPIKGRVYVAVTKDGGQTWKPTPYDDRPIADSGEAFFAASGTNIRAVDNNKAVIVSGGVVSNLFINDQKINIPIVQGKETTGANSIAVWHRYKKKGADHFVVVGGDFNSDSSSYKNCVYSTDRGQTWKASAVPPNGYRSCVEYLAEKQLVTCGLTGVDYSFDGAKTWQPISTESFHVVRIAKNGTAVFLAGTNGKIAKLVFDKKRAH
jgi:photosystem II stability/assembly factor-like uncharacterized protein